MIWDGGMTKASKGIIEANSEIEKAEMEVNLYQLKDRVNNLYFGILLIDEQMAQLDLLKETLMLNQKRIQNAIENGTAFKSDADEIKVELINIEQKKAELTIQQTSLYCSAFGHDRRKDHRRDQHLSDLIFQLHLKTYQHQPA